MFSVKTRREIKDEINQSIWTTWVKRFRRFVEDILRKLEASENFEKILEELKGAK